MIVVLADSTDELHAMSALLAGARVRGGDRAREVFGDVRFSFIGRQPSATVANLITGGPSLPDHGLMTRHQAARALSCSTSTIDRRTDAGALVKVDGKITASSIHAYVRREHV